MTEKRKLSKLLPKLFFTMLYISTFTFGGGFVIVTFMKKKFVDEFKWIDEEEMLDLTALAQSSPGAIAVNAAILVGWKVAGFWGMIVSVIGTIIPPITILSIISLFYKAFATNTYVAMALKGMQAGVSAVIIDVVLGLGKNVFKEKSAILVIIMFVAFIATFVFKVNVMYIIIVTIIIGVIISLVNLKKNKEKESVENK